MTDRKQDEIACDIEKSNFLASVMKERTLLTPEQLEKRKQVLQEQLEKEK